MACITIAIVILFSAAHYAAFMVSGFRQDTSTLIQVSF